MTIWPRTQKARGLISLLHGLKCGSWPAKPSENIVVVPRRPSDTLMSLYDTYNHRKPWTIKFPCFGRPCPTEPRHGFVESRRLDSPEAALDLLAETLHADPNGEMILMPEYTGGYSAVATNAGIAWGHGNAGVTSGVAGENTAFIPAPVSAEKWRNTVCAPLSEVKVCPYVELVEDKGDVYLVQLRDGPPQSGAHGDYIPAEVLVTAVLTPGEVGCNLMRWDKLVRSAAPGTVAVLGFRMTRFSHFAVHCLVNKVPILFGEAPALGTRLTPSDGEPPPRFVKQDYEHVARVIMRHFARRSRIEEVDMNPKVAEPIITAIGVCHAMPGWGTEAHLLRLRGEGVAACFRYSAVACLGEDRHFYKSGPGRHGSVYPTLDMRRILSPADYTEFIGRKMVSRSGTYSAASLLPLSTQIRLLLQARTDFKTAGWRSAFGGKSWAEAAFQTAWLGRSIIAFCAKPNGARWKRLQFRYNATLHACHNNGKVLTKWAPIQALIYGGQAPTLCFMNSFAAKTVLFPSELPSFEALKQEFEKEISHGE